MAVLGLRFCARDFSSCGKWGPLFIAVHGPLTIAASLVVEHRLQTRRLSNCASWAHLLHGLWDLPRPGLEPVSPALAGRFSTTAPPGKPSSWLVLNHFIEVLLTYKKLYIYMYKTWWVWTKVHICETITTIYSINVSIISKSSLLFFMDISFDCIMLVIK